MPLVRNGTVFIQDMICASVYGSSNKHWHHSQLASICVIMSVQVVAAPPPSYVDDWNPNSMAPLNTFGPNERHTIIEHDGSKRGPLGHGLGPTPFN